MLTRRRAAILGIARTLVALGGAAIALAACGRSADVILVQTSIDLPPSPPVAAAPPETALTIGPAAVDTTGGSLPDGTTLSPFDTANPILSQLDPALLQALQNAARDAQAQGVEVRVNSGWRSRGFQQRLFDDAISLYGSPEKAAEFVATPEVSKHVMGQAVDIAPDAADNWLIATGPRYGLCQIYANEIWHFELATDASGTCPPLRPNAAG